MATSFYGRDSPTSEISPNLSEMTYEEQLQLAEEQSRKEYERQQRIQNNFRHGGTNNERGSFFQRHFNVSSLNGMPAVAEAKVNEGEPVGDFRPHTDSSTSFNRSEKDLDLAIKLSMAEMTPEDMELQLAIQLSKLETKSSSNNISPEASIGRIGFDNIFHGPTLSPSHILTLDNVKTLDEIEEEMQRKETKRKSRLAANFSSAGSHSSELIDLTGTLDHTQLLKPSTENPSFTLATSHDTVIEAIQTTTASRQRRPIIVDGCNVAYQHGKNDRYSAKGLVIIYKHLVEKFGYTNEEISIINKPLGKKSDEDISILQFLYKIDVLISTPARSAGNRKIVSDDDLWILDRAATSGGIVISLDQFRDAYEHTTDLEIKDVIENRILQFAFKGDEVIFPRDPMGKGGPSLEEFLHF